IHRAPASSDYDVDKIGVQPNDIDHIDFRYAEVLLIKAEAEFFSNTGDKGLGEINQLRGRVGLTPLTAVTAEDVYKEWDYEFAFEQKHWVNLVRWHRLIQAVLNNVPNYEYYKDVYNDSSAFEDFSYNDTKADPTRFSFYSRVYKHLHAKTNKIDGHFYRFPIPLSASYTDLGITPQNPGY
ncbi:MAG: RagB/SusD family nutrient uptake outer membrane protein, partial [Candidatus Symbiothrix sp.]|nr:RagB/SusD family nutrient uptake outer membrane protein [Candidatus Symbiothrix sp.]